MIGDLVEIRVGAFVTLAPREAFGVPTIITSCRATVGPVVIRYPMMMRWLGFEDLMSDKRTSWRVVRARWNRTQKLLRWARQRKARRVRR